MAGSRGGHQPHRRGCTQPSRPKTLSRNDADVWTRIPAEPAGSACPLCDHSVPPGSIVSETPQMHAALGRPAMLRAFYCEFCAVVVQWTEGATAAGAPNGRLVAGPQLIENKAALEWLRAHGRMHRVHAT